MGKFSIEDKIKERLLGHKVSIDTDDLIQSMGLDQKKRRLLPFWLWLSPLVLLGVLGIFWFTSDNSTIAVELPSKSSDYVQSIETKQIEALGESPTIVKEIPLIETEKVEQKTNTFTQTDIQENKETSQINTNYPLTASKLPLEYTSKNNSQVFSSSSDKTKVVSKSIEQQNLSVQATAVSTSVVEDQTKEIFSSKSKILTSAISEKGSVFPEFTLAHKLADMLTIAEVQLESRIGSLQSIPHTSYGPKVYSPWVIQIASGVSLYERNIEAKNENGRTYADWRNNSEVTLEHISLNLLARYSFRNNIYLKSGISWNRFNSLFQYSEVMETEDVEHETLRHTINYLGDTTATTILPLIGEQTTVRNWEIYNHINVVDIPVMIGYEWKAKKWGLNAEIGILTGVYTGFQGRLRDESQAIAVNPTYYKVLPKFGVESALGGYYKINKHWGIDCSLVYGRSLQSITNSSYSLDENYSRIGSRIGLRYSL